MKTMGTAMHLESESAAGSTGEPAAMRPGLLLPALSLCRRELLRFLRQRHRIVGALATPVVFWLLIGGGMGQSLNLASGAGESYIRFFFPGALAMILLFTAIFSTISIIEDRREGFLQSVLVAPAPRQAVVLGKVLGGTVLAVGQGMVFLALAPLVGFSFTAASLAMTLAIMSLIAFALTALGFCIAWHMNSSQGFHAIMNLFLMPMWFLSGALFPAKGAWWGLKGIMAANPLTYGVSGLRHALVMAAPDTPAVPGPALWISIVVTGGFAATLFALATWISRRESAADLT